MITAAVLLSAASVTSPSGCIIPSLIGRSLAQSRRALAAQSCPASALQARTSCGPAAKAGLVLDQRPAPGRRLGKGQRIAVHIGRACSAGLVAWNGSYTGIFSGEHDQGSQMTEDTGQLQFQVANGRIVAPTLGGTVDAAGGAQGTASFLPGTDCFFQATFTRSPGGIDVTGSYTCSGPGLTGKGAIKAHRTS